MRIEQQLGGQQGNVRLAPLEHKARNAIQRQVAISVKRHLLDQSEYVDRRQHLRVVQVEHLSLDKHLLDLNRLKKALSRCRAL